MSDDSGSSWPESIEVQRSDELSCECPSDHLLIQWARAGLENTVSKEALTIRIVDEVEIRSCNNQWRGKDSVTNVLSFTADFPPEAGMNYLGDMMVCAEVLKRESAGQSKALNDHWAHIVVHGVLHLRGFDHENEQDAAIMEEREKEILATLGVADPYRDEIEG